MPFIAVTFENIPNDGVVNCPLPSFNELVKMIRNKCSGELLEVIDNPKDAFSETFCERLANAIWQVLNPFIINFPHEELAFLFGKLIAGNPVFSSPGQHFSAVVAKKVDSKYRGSILRLDRIKKLKKDFGYPASCKSNYWPFTTKLLYEVYENLWRMGHRSHDQAIKDAVKLHFENPTYTNLQRQVFETIFMQI